MELVSTLSPDHAADSIRPTMEGIMKKTGKISSMLGTLAHAPDMFQAFLAVNATMGKTKLDGKLREEAYLLTSILNDCHYCVHYHTLACKRVGVEDAKIAELQRYETSDLFNELEKDVLRFAEQSTRKIAVDPALASRLREALGEREYVELAFVVASANLTTRYNVALGNDI